MLGAASPRAFPRWTLSEWRICTSNQDIIDLSSFDAGHQRWANSSRLKLIDGEMSVCETTTEATEVKRCLLTSKWTSLICLFISCSCAFSFWRKSWFPPVKNATNASYFCEDFWVSVFMSTLRNIAVRFPIRWIIQRVLVGVRMFVQASPEKVKNPWQFRAPHAHLVAEFPGATVRTLGQKQHPSEDVGLLASVQRPSSPRWAFARWKRSWAPHLLGSGWLNRSDRNKRLREGGELDFQPTWERSSTFLLMKGNTLIPDVSL